MSEKKVKYICSVCKKGHRTLYDIDNELYCLECIGKEFYVVENEVIYNDDDK